METAIVMFTRDHPRDTRYQPDPAHPRGTSPALAKGGETG